MRSLRRTGSGQPRPLCHRSIFFDLRGLIARFREDVFAAGGLKGIGPQPNTQTVDTLEYITARLSHVVWAGILAGKGLSKEGLSKEGLKGKENKRSKEKEPKKKRLLGSTLIDPL